MAWIAVDADGIAYKYGKKPVRATDCWMPDAADMEDCVKVLTTTMILLCGVRTWEDEPIELN